MPHKSTDLKLTAVQHYLNISLNLVETSFFIRSPIIQIRIS